MWLIKLLFSQKVFIGCHMRLKFDNRYTTFCSLVWSIRNERQISMPKIIENFKRNDKLKKKLDYVFLNLLDISVFLYLVNNILSHLFNKIHWELSFEQNFSSYADSNNFPFHENTVYHHSCTERTSTFSVKTSKAKNAIPILDVKHIQI